MNNFAFISYYSDKDSALKIIQQVLKKQIDDGEIGNFILNLAPLELLHLPRIESRIGSVTNGDVIFAPLLLKYMASLDEEIILEKILSSIAIAIAKKANIICLAGVLGEYAPLVRERIKEKAVLITGRKFLTSTIIDNILEISRLMKINLNKTKIAILDINSPVGRTCAQMLEAKFEEISIFDKDNRGRENFSELQNTSPARVKITGSLKEVLGGAKLVINTLLLFPEEAINYLEPDSIFFDAIVPYWGSKAVSAKRKDVLSIETAWTTRGPLIQRELDFVFPKDAIFCCLAETTMLSLEGDINPDLIKLKPENVTTMKKIGEKHGFFLPAFRCGEKIYNIGVSE